nr:cytochrome c [uncultured Psychroserpens sp.]
MRKISVAIVAIVAILILVSCNSSEKKTNTSEEKEKTKLEASMARGKNIYTNFCISCHLPNGKGLPKVFPPLAKSDYLKNNRLGSIRSIKYGQSGEIIVNGQTYNGVMAPLGLNDEEIADVMNYITNSWGNYNAKLITVKEVSAIEE